MPLLVFLQKDAFRENKHFSKSCTIRFLIQSKFDQK
jgi:hypothetical protein